MIPDTLQNLSIGLRRKFLHQTRLNDGEIYRKVWASVKRGEEQETEALMALLSRCKEVALKRLLKSDFNDSFVQLMKFPGLLVGLMLGNVQRLLALGCITA